MACSPRCTRIGQEVHIRRQADCGRAARGLAEIDSAGAPEGPRPAEFSRTDEPLLERLGGVGRGRIVNSCAVRTFGRMRSGEEGTHMAKVKKTITINAPVEKVFAFMAEPTNLPSVWPSMVEVRDLQPSPGGGHNFGWVYKMAGMRIEGASETTGYVLNERVVTRSTKGIQSKFVWTYTPEGGATRLAVEVEYTVPVPLLGKIAEAVIVKQNEREAEILLSNLKARMEA